MTRGRVTYLVLCGLSVLGVLSGVILLTIGSTTVWVPESEGSNTYDAHLVPLTAPGTWLLAVGAILGLVILLLDTYVGPVHRRTAELEPAGRPPAD